jgi:hypothetical protein
VVSFCSRPVCIVGSKHQHPLYRWLSGSQSRPRQRVKSKHHAEIDSRFLGCPSHCLFCTQTGIRSRGPEVQNSWRTTTSPPPLSQLLRTSQSRSTFSACYRYSMFFILITNNFFLLMSEGDGIEFCVVRSSPWGISDCHHDVITQQRVLSVVTVYPKWPQPFAPTVRFTNIKV